MTLSLFCYPINGILNDQIGLRLLEYLFVLPDNFWIYTMGTDGRPSVVERVNPRQEILFRKWK